MSKLNWSQRDELPTIDPIGDLEETEKTCCSYDKNIVIKNLVYSRYKECSCCGKILEKDI